MFARMTQRRDGYSSSGALRGASILFWLTLALLTLSATIVTAAEPIKSASEYDYPPFAVTTKDGQADGFSVELLREALRAVGRDVQFKVGPWHALKQELVDGKIQVLPFVGRNAERQLVYDFTAPYLSMHGTLVVRKGDSRIRRLDDLRGKTVVVLKGDNAEEYVREHRLTDKVATTETLETALRQLAAGQHDAMLVQKLAGESLIRTLGLDNLEAVGPPIDRFQNFCFAVRLGDKELLSTLNEGLALIIANGTVESLREKWIAPTRDEIYANVRNSLGIVLGVILLGAVPAYLVHRSRLAEVNRRSAQSAESEKRLSALFDRASDGILIMSPEGKLVATNDSFARMHGYTTQELHSLSLKDLDTPETFRLVPGRMQRILSGEPATFDVEHYHKDGHTISLEVSASLVVSDGEPLIQCFHRDITERKQAEAKRSQLEAQLRESQKMEALGTMAGGVAHDFNNALAMIIGNTELARQDVGPDHPALVSLEEIGKASRRAKDLVQQILSFGRRQQLDRKATSLALVVVETARLARATLPAMVGLNVNCEPDAPAVLADATQIKQILLNLCSNAIQAIQDQGNPGKVEINLGAHVQSEAAGSSNLKEGRYACLTVRDTGPGMDEATRSHIFEPFFTTKPVGKGTGLGLAVVHGIVQAHEAAIDVESAPGKGSVFRIYFPAIDAQVEEFAQPGEGAIKVDGAGKRVLYIDDEEAVIFLMRRLLERQGFRVSGFTNPREALAAAQANPGEFDLAVTDFNMPGMSGLDVASALREIRPDLPVVLASGYITEDLRQRAPAAGVRELIYKPNTVDDLCEAVARYANSQDGKDKPS